MSIGFQFLLAENSDKFSSDVVLNKCYLLYAFLKIDPARRLEGIERRRNSECQKTKFENIDVIFCIFSYR